MGPLSTLASIALCTLADTAESTFVAYGCLDGVHTGAVAASGRADGVIVGHVHGNNAGAGGHAAGIAGAHGQHHQYFPAVAGHGDAATVERGGVAIGTGAAHAVERVNDLAG